MKVDRYALRQAARTERMVADIQRVGLHRARGVVIVPTSLGGPVMHCVPGGGA